MDTIADLTTRQQTTARQARVAVPLLLGGAVAAWVGQTAFLTPGADYTAPNFAAWLVPVLVVAFAAVLARRGGLLQARGASAAVVGLTAFALLLYSIGLGLTAVGLAWVVALVAAFGFLATAGVAALLIRMSK